MEHEIWYNCYMLMETAQMLTAESKLEATFVTFEE